MDYTICPDCGSTMSYDPELDILVCKECGHTDIYSIGEIVVPEGCRACGGPYPNCMTSCNIFDD